MEEVIARFPHLVEEILNSLSNKSLVGCREVNKTWQEFISNERFYKKRIEDERFKRLRRLMRLPYYEGEKLSKANILQLTDEDIYQLEQEKTRLLLQKIQLKRLTSWATSLYSLPQQKVCQYCNLKHSLKQ